MATINPYLNFEGKTEEAFNFYKSVFGGEFTVIQRFKDMPDGDKMSVDDQNKIMHVSLPINGNVLMGTDTLESMGQKLNVGDNFSVSVNTDSEAESDQIFNALAVGGEIIMPLEKAFWGAYFGMLKDRFGIQWLVNFDYNEK
ncbi:VOC family protein [Pedobacter steynii]|uniref:Glyoxalase n=1 Tax=Pedobacter steynii TaxID=430522 RepID=A0A1D7QMV9_9SPHI|nr:VOC family protein [Pedobacter steynii]AOM79993.1 glyoxalase [Pedobacter steynii]